MSSPASEIIVSNEPPPSSPPQSIDRPISPEIPPVEPPQHDPNSKKSFKRKYRKLLRKYGDIRAKNEHLHTSYSKAISLTQQLSNENANILDLLYDLDTRVPPATRTLKSTTEDDELPEDAPSPSSFPYDPHFGYTPTPSPPPEVATQLTQEQIDMGMIKVEPGSGMGVQQGAMGPPAQPVQREESVDAFRGRSTGRRGSNAIVGGSRKRKDRDSDGEEVIGTTGRKKTRG